MMGRSGGRQQKAELTYKELELWPNESDQRLGRGWDARWKREGRGGLEESRGSRICSRGRGTTARRGAWGRYVISVLECMG